jgi:hypothetical protein
MTAIRTTMTAPDPTPRAQALLDLWHAKRRDGRLPARSDFAFEDFRPWLGWLTLLEVRDGGTDFYFTLHGTAAVDRYRLDMTGKLASALPPHWSKTILAGYRDVVRTAQPALSRHRLKDAQFEYFWLRLLLPCADDGRNVDRLIALIEDIEYVQRPLAL